MTQVICVRWNSRATPLHHLYLAGLLTQGKLVYGFMLMTEIDLFQTRLHFSSLLIVQFWWAYNFSWLTSGNQTGLLLFVVVAHPYPKKVWCVVYSEMLLCSPQLCEWLSELNISCQLRPFWSFSSNLSHQQGVCCSVILFFIFLCLLRQSA